MQRLLNALATAGWGVIVYLLVSAVVSPAHAAHPIHAAKLRLALHHPPAMRQAPALRAAPGRAAVVLAGRAGAIVSEMGAGAVGHAARLGRPWLVT